MSAPDAQTKPEATGALAEQVYLDERPAEYFDRFYKHANTREPGWTHTACA